MMFEKAISTACRAFRRADLQVATKRTKQRGVTLIEVMASMLVFSFGLLGLVGLQARATQYSIGAEDTTRAALLANEMSSSMVLTNTLYFRTEIIDAWSARVADTTRGGLPNGAGTIATAGRVATITISWRPPGVLADYRYSTQVILP